MRDGFGKYREEKGGKLFEYIGYWKNDLKEGYGKCFYYSEDFYAGEWKNDKRDGKMGDMFYKRGDRYRGAWKKDYKHGKGTLYYQNG